MATSLPHLRVHQPPTALRRFGPILTKDYPGVRTKPNGKANQHGSALIRIRTGVFVFVRTTTLDLFGFVRFRLHLKSEANEDGRSLKKFVFSVKMNDLFL